MTDRFTVQINLKRIRSLHGTAMSRYRLDAIWFLVL